MTAEIDQAEPSECTELRIAYREAERAHLRAWQELAFYQETLSADIDPSHLSPAARARLKHLVDESAATAHAWTQAFTTWFQSCGALSC